MAYLALSAVSCLPSGELQRIQCMSTGHARRFQATQMEHISVIIVHI